MDNKTETPEEKEAFDAIERKQCQCARVNSTQSEISMKVEIEGVMHFLSDEAAWTWDNHGNDKEHREYLHDKLAKVLDLLKGDE